MSEQSVVGQGGGGREGRLHECSKRAAKEWKGRTWDRKRVRGARRRWLEGRVRKTVREVGHIERGWTLRKRRRGDERRGERRQSVAASKGRETTKRRDLAGREQTARCRE